MPLFLTILTVNAQTEAQVWVQNLLNYKTTWVDQVEQQVGRTRSVVASNRISGFSGHVAVVEEAVQYGHDEVNRLAQSLIGISEECATNLPTTPESIRTSANDFMGRCVDLVLNSAGVVGEDEYFQAFEGYRTFAMDSNFIFARDLFRFPLDINSLFFYLDMADLVTKWAIQWDNIDNLELFNLRAESKAALEPIGPALSSCITDFKDFIATEYARVVLYLGGC